jgi:hypothetical protein
VKSEEWVVESGRWKVEKTYWLPSTGYHPLLVTMVRKLSSVAIEDAVRSLTGKMTWMFLCLSVATVTMAQMPGVHSVHQGVMPPGAIGSRQLLRGGPLPGFFQPVEIKAPGGALVSLAAGGQFVTPQAAPVRVGLLIGSVYRLRVTNIPLSAGQEVFPSIELVDRLYTPVDQQWRFPIPIELSEEDLRLALSGKFVTRVIYLEDPDHALPVKQAGTQNWFEVAPGGDPLMEADAMGRPVAILRLGGRLPNDTPDASFFFGCPPYWGQGSGFGVQDAGAQMPAER